jgi:tetratricopeptide (TPR) repeat protein
VADPIGVLEDLEQSVRTGVASHLDPQLAQFGNLVTRPPSYEAYEAYVVGMERYWQLDFHGAIEAFASAAEIAPEFATPQLVAASAHLNLGRCDEAQTIVENLQEQRRSLAPHDRLYLDWLGARCRGDRNRAVEVARQAVELSPQSSWAQTLGVDALQANRPALAARVLAPLDTDRGLLRGWTAHFFYLTAAWHLVGDHARELQDAQRGRRLYPTSVHAVLGEARALAALGKEEELFDLLREAESFPREFLSTPGSAMTLAALELEAHGRGEAAQQAAEMAVDWYRRRPSEQAEDPFYQEGLARALFTAKKYSEAEQAFRRLAQARGEGVDVKGFLGVLAAHRGDASVNGTVEQLRSLDQPYTFGKQHYWMAAILAWQGEADAALRELRQAVAAGHPFEWPELHPHVDPIWRPLRNDPAFLDFIEPRG